MSTSEATARVWRPLFGRLHRWVGLLLAGFLVVTGLTGAVISWDHELDELLNPHLLDAKAAGPALSSIALAKAIEARHPTVQVTYFPLAAKPGHALSFSVEPRVEPRTQRLHEETFNQVFVDPADGTELGRREWGAVWPITRETFVSFLYKLHYSLHLPELAGNDRWGVWLLGVIAILWTLDCFVGFYLTLPPARPRKQAGGRSFWDRWKPSWRVRWRGGAYRVNFDLHRAAGLWTWIVLFTVAFTGFSMNLYQEVFYPVMSLVSNVTPTPFDQRAPADPHHPIEPRVPLETAVSSASEEAKRRGWEEPAGSVFYSRAYGIYSISFYRPEDGHGAGGVGHRQLYVDSQDGRVLGERLPWKGTAADIFMQAQFPLHSGRILGLPGRILISLIGLVVSGLSITGVYIWWRKRRNISVLAQRSQLAVT